ncbi:N-acetylglucosamine/diacetylchitobiose ABC transporter substrate-binding protein [Oscillochloris sp. ZM17-4]|uniref:N-acetylglucosamine/diacetylchitobiose ABC transporter substrate-binding protein n=1 Tax=Oscillochloris sp. ZM17-4 TaxID=2866714 RepID=UPI001C72C99F|nr:N-acetylglucosamine/diacetylchitobiose ABC transporter substrate-binding protein [Oscillochloris sp. ZM17-4]MBX0328024.1 N-acetylglucosamine/diacetylchitobiose ABC transporter substrate-binding protein [Oscillochloris sp. ZM17-4]
MAISRREFLKATVAGGGTAFAGLVLAACGAQTPAAAPTAVPAAAAPTAAPAAASAGANPLNVAAGEVDGVFFAGGFGDDYIKYTGTLVEKAHPDVTVKIQSVQKVTESLQPRFIAGTPPDVIDNSGANLIPMSDLVTEEQLLDLAPLLSAPSWDTPGKTFGETLFPGSQTSAIFGGKQYGINIAYTISGIWYSKPGFAASGYTYPKTWDEMLVLCEQIKKDGKASPWTYQGKYPYYIWGIVWNMLVYYAGGDDVIKKLDNLEPNAWSDPAILRATEDLYQLWDKGYILPGTAGLTHTESQTEWLKGSATFIPCGNWLENEMKTVTPAGFDMTVANIPGYADGKGDQNAVNANGGETYVVPSKAKNTAGGMEYLRALLSKDSAKYFAENVRAIMPVVGGTDGATLSEGMKAGVALATASNGVAINMNFTNWYSQLNKEIEQRTGELMTGTIKPAEFITAMQKAADTVAADPDITKFTR